MSDEQLSFRWGIPWLDFGYVTIPSFFFRRYAEAGVSREEFLFVLHLANFKFESRRGESRPSLGTIAREMEYSVRQVRRLRASLEAKALLTVSPRQGRPSVYSFENLARRLLQLELTPDTGVTPDTHVRRTPDTHVRPPRTPMSSEEQETRRRKQQQQVVVVSSPSAQEGNGGDGIGEVGLSEKMVEELKAEFGTPRVHAVVRAVLGKKSVRDKGAWVISALRKGWEMGEDWAASADYDRLRLTAKTCAFARKPAMGKCPTEEQLVHMSPWCLACHRGLVAEVV